MLHTIIEKMIFYPEQSFLVNPDYFRLQFEDIEFRAEDGVRLHGWFFPGKREETVLFFHGNAGNIADRLDNVYRLVKRGLSVFIIDYRGYGRSEGYPTETGTYLDATAAWVWLQESGRVKPDRIVIFGRSLGGAVALELTTRTPPWKLIIESTFSSVRDMARGLFPFIPGVLIPDKYPNMKRISKVSCPILVIHGRRDSLVPFSHGENLFRNAPDPKEFYALDHADHNDTYLVEGSVYFDRFISFIEKNHFSGKYGDPG